MIDATLRIQFDAVWARYEEQLQCPPGERDKDLMASLMKEMGRLWAQMHVTHAEACKEKETA